MNVNTNRMIELALVFFVSLLSFSIGTYVGKKYSDNQHRLAKLEPHSEKAQELAKEMGGLQDVVHSASGSEPIIASNKPESLTDTEVAQLAEEFSEDEEVKATEKKITELKVEKPKALAKSKEVKTISNDENGEGQLVREVASIASKAKKIVAQENIAYTVQVAAYPSSEEAEKMVATLGARGYKGKAVEADVNGRKWYRVQIGHFDTFKDAETYKIEVMEQNRLTSALVQKISK